MIVTMIVALCELLLMDMAWTEECQECHLVGTIYHRLLVLEQQCVTLIMYLHVALHYQALVHRKLKSLRFALIVFIVTNTFFY